MSWDQVGKELTLMAEAHGRKFSKESAAMMLSDLQQYGPGPVLRALAACRLQIRYFPTIAEIVDRVPGAVSDAALADAAVSRIIQAVSAIGPYRHDDAKEFVGELGWRVVKQYAGWEELCKSLGEDTPVGVFKSQALKTALMVIERSRAGVLSNAPELPAPRSGYTVGVDMAIGPSKLIIHVQGNDGRIGSEQRREDE